MTFEEFIFKKFKSYSHGHYLTHEEVDGLFYRHEDYEKAVEQFENYQFKTYLQGVKNEKSNELARRRIIGNRRY